MALVQASRTSELEALDTRFRVYKPDSVAALTKKRTPGLPSKELFFAFPDDMYKSLRMVECLHHYKRVTLEFRTATREAALFLSYTRPHKPITSQGLAHWIKDLMGEAGVDTKTFKHIQGTFKVRGGSRSSAFSKGVSLADIPSTAGSPRFKDSRFQLPCHASKVLRGSETW